MKKFISCFCFILVTQCASDPAFWQAYSTSMYQQQQRDDAYRQRINEITKRTTCYPNAFGGFTCY